MLDWVTVDVLSTAGLSTIVGGVIVSLVRGWLVPKSQVDRLDAAYQRQLQDAWAASAAHSARADVAQAQLNRLLDAAYPALRVVSDEAL